MKPLHQDFGGIFWFEIVTLSPQNELSVTRDVSRDLWINEPVDVEGNLPL